MLRHRNLNGEVVLCSTPTHPTVTPTHGHSGHASDLFKERTASQSSCVSGLSSTSTTSDGQKKYEIISSPMTAECTDCRVR